MHFCLSFQISNSSNGTNLEDLECTAMTVKKDFHDIVMPLEKWQMTSQYGDVSTNVYERLRSRKWWSKLLK